MDWGLAIKIWGSNLATPTIDTHISGHPLSWITLFWGRCKVLNFLLEDDSQLFPGLGLLRKRWTKICEPQSSCIYQHFVHVFLVYQLFLDQNFMADNLTKQFFFINLDTVWLTKQTKWRSNDQNIYYFKNLLCSTGIWDWRLKSLLFEGILWQVSSS